ncbi:hypothetical protein TNCV_3773671 [Trichonephila clavipes]|nr:hypothetical protein TNCV_3773671 [Trichonephila clavipes]
MKRLKWCPDYLNWTQLQLKQVIWSEESLFTLFQATGLLFFWQTSAVAFHVDCHVSNCETWRRMVLGAISFRGFDLLVVLEGEDHRRPLSKHSLSPSSMYVLDSLSGRTSFVPRWQCLC